MTWASSLKKRRRKKEHENRKEEKKRVEVIRSILRALQDTDEGLRPDCGIDRGNF
ncbi:conserved hypothetical protein [Ricinus communis]|uniref:Uncharacterized protein n=1 Tax=Ricinus communis TaxID=3988 RepID=B9SW24_RICCO|nr:conserved hypothetical protein [Ricinus communis]